jgi:protein-tyrosine phosphatase
MLGAMARQLASTPRLRPRIVDWIPGTANLRDFGGYTTLTGGRVRMSLLYRSGFTHGIPNHGLAELAQDLGIRTVIDLRTEGERKRGLSDFEAHGLRPVHEPLLTSLATDEELAPSQLARRILQGGFDWLVLYRSILEEYA